MNVASGDGVTPERLERWRRRVTPPANEIPTVVPVGTVVGRTAEVVVAIVSVRVFSTGVYLDTSIRLRSSRREDRLTRMLGMGRADADDAVQRFLLGVEYADGRRASLAPRHLGPAPEVPDDVPVLSGSGGGGGGKTWESHFWLSPVPPDGDLTVVVRWEGMGIPETSTVLSGLDLTTASGAVHVLWSDVPDEPWQPAEPTLPASGWFARPR